MRRTRIDMSGPRTVAMLSVFVVGATLPSNAIGQGCMPIRYTSPTLTTQAELAPRDGDWEIAIAYRWLRASQFFVGHDYRPELAPGGQPSRIGVHSMQVEFSYAPTSRLKLSLGIPVATGTHSRLQGDNLRHTFSSAGIGDVSLVGSMWLLDPVDHPTGNVALSLGVKAPTGQTAKMGEWHTASATEQRPLDPSIQLGDGGWGGIVRLQAFQHLVTRTAAYAAFSYLANPRAHIDAKYVLPYGVIAPVAVTDEYSAHAGLTFDASRARKLAISLGARIDGVPVHDVVGGGDDSFRRPGYALYVEPALAIRLSRSPLSPDRSTLTLGVPIRVDQNRRPSALDLANGRAGGGDFAKFLVFVGYSRRL